MISPKYFKEFEKVSKLDLIKTLDDSRSFFKEDYGEILSFFTGRADNLKSKHVRKLNRLISELSVISSFFGKNKTKFNKIDFWEILDKVEDIKTKLDYVVKLPKYIRSSIVSSASSNGLVFDYKKSKYQSLEDLTLNVLEENNFDNSWIEQAIRNDLKEIDYGDKDVSLSLKKAFFQTSLVTTFVDYNIGDRIYGKDLSLDFSFENDDLKVLNYNETLEQSINVLIRLKKGDLPEFRKIGLNSDFSVGSNFSQINYPSIFRNLKNNFDTDNLFKNFNVINVSYESGDIFVDYEVETVNNDVITKTGIKI